jgi:hypothetical protein
LSSESKQNAIFGPAGAPEPQIDVLMDSFYRVRAAVHDLLASVGADPSRTRESSRRLGLSRQLTWRLSRVVCSTEPESILSDIPGPQGMSKLVAACRELGAPEENVNALLSAAESFEEAVEAISGDRKTLAALMANQGDRQTNGSQERERRKLFEAGSAVWGVHAATRFVSVFLFPAKDDPTMLDVAHVTGYLGFRRLRSIPWPMSFEEVRDSEGVHIPFVKEPLDLRNGSDEGQLQLISRFCNPPTPSISVSTVGNVKRFELEPGPIGNAGAADVVFGTYLRHLYPRTQDADNLNANFILMLVTPVERVIFDMFLHKDIEVSAMPTAHLCDKLTHPFAPADHEVERLAMPLYETPQALGPGATGALTPHIPWYPRLVRFVSERIDRAPEEFVGTRFEMNYPPMPTSIVRGFPLAPRES